MWGVPWASCALSLPKGLYPGTITGRRHGLQARSPCLRDLILARLPGDAMGLQRALPDMVPVKPVAGGAASVEGAPSHAPVILVGANLFHCPLLYIPASVLLVWAWRGMPSGRIVYFRKSNNFNPNNQTFVKFFMSLRYSLKIIHYLCTRAVL